MKRYLILLIHMMLVGCIFLTSCDSKSDERSPFLIVDNKELLQSFTADNQSKKVSIFSTQQVDISLSPSEAGKWCQVSIDPSTLGESTLLISVAHNEVKTKREATITLNMPNYREIDINVVQAGIVLPLKLTDFEPKSGGKGDVLTLTGENFGDMVSNIQVLFSGTQADIESVNENEIKIIVPQMSQERDYQVKVQRFEMEATYAESFSYEKRWWVENVIVDVLPSAIAVDNDGSNILYLRRFEDARLGGELGIYRVNLKTNQQTHLVNNGFVPGGYGYTGVTYDKVSKKFYVIAEVGGTTMHILSIDPANGWKVVDNSVEGGVSGYWAPGLTSSQDGKLYSRQWNGSVIEINPQSWKATTVASLVPHGAKDVSPALAFATGTNKLYMQIRESSELAYASLPDGNITWLNTSIETGLYDGLLGEARFLRGEQMCSDNDGNIYLVDQDNHAIRMITPERVKTVIGGNGAGAQNGMGLKATFNAPSGLAIDGNEILYIGDTWNASIRKAIRQ